MKISNKGLLEIVEHEGIVPAPYLDSKGIVTYGVGHTSFAGGLDPREMNSAMPADEDIMDAVYRALEVFRDDLEKYEARVNEHIKAPLKQHEFDALVSFDFNTGGIWYRSKSSRRMVNARLVTAINSGEPNAARHFMGWLKPPEIRKRREAEMNLFETGDYDANGDKIRVYKTNGALKLSGTAMILTGADVLRMMGRIPADHEKPVGSPVTGVTGSGGEGDGGKPGAGLSGLISSLFRLFAALLGRK